MQWFSREGKHSQDVALREDFLQEVTCQLATALDKGEGEGCRGGGRRAEQEARKQLEQKVKRTEIFQNV